MARADGTRPAKGRKTAKKTAPATAAKAAKAGPAKRTPKHGRGALLAGGQPGNKGGAGRPPSEVRARCLGSFDRRIAVAEAIADSATATDADRLKALDLLGKYAGLQKIETEVRDATLEDLIRRAAEGAPLDGAFLDEPEGAS